MNDYNFDGHIAMLQKIYGRKCDLMLSCMDEGFGDRVTYNKPEGGLFIWCNLHQDIHPAEFSAKCAELGVTFIPGNMLAVSPADCTDAFRLNFSTPSDQQIVEGIGKMSSVLKALKN
ncbi:hypothetical protein [Paenibacillus sp. HW567]|uniref:hypothetical protein n=1 Tax=Paenibacillus sp. HW567 TaxID=1034769 RepID=UPI0003A22C1D|nr:hypothetical protein [Paenibacillus sp. HW567]